MWRNLDLDKATLVILWVYKASLQSRNVVGAG